ncbi:hypothetical protein Pint_16215 [Pistacia integerrima]|uniref:Uncharacterized protein n=1 Tax=Pistacia integerrima TaxID=434235 RepID=A0ACC0ZB04_9ROSI|nr:hypothetical protein Pint_16215 [Pistacia integerrima]
MGEASNQRGLPTSTNSPAEKQLSVTLNPVWRTSPRPNGSTLFDSYELQAVTHQLNKAMQGTTGSPTYINYIKSPFFHQRLGRIYKENAKTPKKIMCSQAPFREIDRKVNTRAATREFLARLWKKVKQGWFRTNQKSYS